MSVIERIFLFAALALCGGLAHADIYRSLDNPTLFTNVLPNSGRWELYLKEKPAAVAPAPRNGRLLAVPGRTRYASQIQAAAAAHNVDAALIRAVITVESGYNPSAVSRAGAVGLMQLMPETARRYNVTDSRNPEQNIHGGTQYLGDLMRMFDNRLPLVLAAYNAGEKAVMKYGNRIPPYAETVAYVPKVLLLYKQYSGARGLAPGSSYRPTSSASGTIRVSRTYGNNSRPAVSSEHNL